MAKKTKTYSQVQATDALEQLGGRGTTAQEFIYELLRIFAGYGDGQVRRTKEGPGNLAKDGETVLIKNLVAYRPATGDNAPGGDCSKLYDVINAMRGYAKIAKRSPRLYITSDGVNVVAYNPKENDWYENSIALLWKDFEFFTPLAGIEKIQFTEEAEADVKSAELMAKLFDDIRRYNNIRDPQMVHAINIFMSRLLFCFFAEDTGLFPGENLFTNTLRTHTKEDGSDLGEFIDRAFLAMSTDDPTVLDSLPKMYEVFPYVNGGLFRDRYPIPVLSRRARTLIINCGEYNWREINPDIFGSMIQAVVTPEQRAGLGMHYTSVPNIEKVIRPLFLDALEEEFKAACAEAREKMAKKGNPDRASHRLRTLLTRLSQIKIFDPACGSGNFLIITYKRLRELEIRIWKAIREITKVAILPFPSITLTQFYGIELDEYACDTATLSLWLAEHQMNVKFQEELYVLPETLPLKPSGHIVCGNACRLDWNTVCPHTSDEEVYIMGNPPYLGSRHQEESHKDDMEHVFLKDYKSLDYISCWFFLGKKYIEDTKAECAFVTTNSICQGLQVALLWKRILTNGVEISFAHNSFRWSNNARYNAAVTVAVIGLTSHKRNKYLYHGDAKATVNNINAYLSASDNVFIDNCNKPICKNIPSIDFGNMAADGGMLLFDTFEKNEFTEKEPESEPFFRRFYGSEEYINDKERWCLWLDGFSVTDFATLPLITERINKLREIRLKSSRPQLAVIPHLFAQITQDVNFPCVIIPRVSSENREYIPIGFLPSGIVIGDSCMAISNAPFWLFAILTSSMHMTWVRAVGGKLETRYRYSAGLCYNPYPFPNLTTADKEELERLAQNILDIREENFEMTLGEMYNPETMPEELREAHRQLDLAVEHIYRPEPFTSDEERLEHLFKLYAKMTKK